MTSCQTNMFKLAHTHCSYPLPLCTRSLGVATDSRGPGWHCRALSQAQADSLLRMWERDVMLGTLDDLWLQYLLETQRLQRAVNLRCAAVIEARGA